MGNLPAASTSFVNRRRELIELRRLLSVARLVTLTGPAGVGKTRLALRAAAEVGRSFPDGTWLAELAEVRDGALVAHAVAQALRIHDAPGRPPLRLLVDYLRNRRLLLVLDNCEHLVDGCAELADALLREVDSVRLLVTSRQVLAVDGEHVYTVPPLAFPSLDPANSGRTAGPGYSAVTLFAERASAAQPDFMLNADNEGLIGAICRRLDGLPLAIELAAIRLRTLSPEQILDRLDDRFRVLAAGRRTGLPQQRTLRAAVDWSFDLCNRREQVVWARLSVFAGSFAVDAVEEVCAGDGIARERLCEILDALVTKSILDAREHGPQMRFRMLETLREYGRQRLREAGSEELLRRRHADWYLALAERGEREWFGPTGVDLLVRLHAEHANLRAALDFYLTASGEPVLAMRLAAALWFYWANSGPFAEARYWLDRTLAIEGEPMPYRAKALWVAGYAAILDNDLDRADRLLDEAARLAGAAGDHWLRGWALGRMQSLAMIRLDYDRALTLAPEVLREFAVAGEPDGAGTALAHIVVGTSHMFQCAYTTAVTAAEQARSICRRHGERWVHGLAVLVLARVAWMRGEGAAACRWAQDALRLRRGGPLPAALMPALELLAWGTEAAGHYEKAAVLHGAVHQIRHLGGLSAAAAAPSVFFADPGRESVDRTRQALGPDTFDAAFQRGTRLSPDDVVRFALGEKPRRGQRPRAPQGPARLTPRERQVAELVAAGLSNKQIAMRLVISQRTAESHIEHLLGKLGFTSRAQIAAWATREPDA